jgi:hypothetical protein
MGTLNEDGGVIKGEEGRRNSGRGLRGMNAETSISINKNTREFSAKIRGLSFFFPLPSSSFDVE